MCLKGGKELSRETYIKWGRLLAFLLESLFFDSKNCDLREEHVITIRNLRDFSEND